MDIKDYDETTCETCLYRSLPGSSPTCMRCLSKFNTCGIKIKYFPQKLEVRGAVAVPRDFDVTGCFIDQLREELDRKAREATLKEMVNTALLTPNKMRRMFGMEEVKEPALQKKEEPLYVEGYKDGYAVGRESVLKELGIQQFQYDFLKAAFAYCRKEKEDVSSEAE